MIRRGWRWALALALLTPLAAGCWDQLPRMGIAEVSALGVEPAPHGRYRWEFVFPNVTISAANLVNLSPGKQYSALTVVRRTFPAALQAVQDRLSRIVYVGQLQVLALADTLSTPQAASIVTALNQMAPLPKSFWTVTGPPPLVPWLVASPARQIVVPQYELADIFSCHCLSMIVQQRGWKFWASLITPGGSAVLPWIDGPRLAIDRVAVYPATGRPLLMSRQETRGFAYLTGRMRRGVLTVTHGGRSVTLNYLRDSTVVALQRTAGTIVAHIAIDARGKVAAESAPVPTATVGTWIAQAIAADSRAAVAFANRTHTDPFGWARTLSWTRHAALADVAPNRWAALPLKLYLRIRVSLIPAVARP